LSRWSVIVLVVSWKYRLKRKEHEVNYEDMNRTELDEAGAALQSELVGLQDEQDELLAALTTANWDRYVEVNDRIEDVKDALSEADGVYLMNFVW